MAKNTRDRYMTKRAGRLAITEVILRRSVLTAILHCTLPVVRTRYLRNAPGGNFRLGWLTSDPCPIFPLGNLNHMPTCSRRDADEVCDV